jgi:hypothetical protein
MLQVGGVRTCARLAALSKAFEVSGVETLIGWNERLLAGEKAEGGGYGGGPGEFQK